MKYRVNWRYYSSYGGPFEKGSVEELDEELAEAINRDSPGVLTLVKEKARALEAPPADRMVKEASKRGEDIMSSESQGYGAEIAKKNLKGH